jgi:DNA-binding transcriptional LysR family regulator
MKTPQGRDRIKRFLRHGSLPQLAAFYAVVQMGSVTRAAEALCVAQPTLSGHLRKLSESLGVVLFEARGKTLVPTDSAMVLLETAKQVFAAFEQCELRLASLRVQSSGSGNASEAKPSDLGPVTDAAIESAQELPTEGPPSTALAAPVAYPRLTHAAATHAG